MSGPVQAAIPRPPYTDLSLSLIVLTYNEELNLAHCLESVRGLASEIFVVDSNSSDRTGEIAREFTPHVYMRAFTTQAEQFNWALDNLPIQSDWVLRLDADEFLLPALRDEIQRVLPSLSPDVGGLMMKRRVYFKGRWIRHGGYYPTWLLRLFRRGQARSEPREMDEHIVVSQGRTHRLQHDFVDYNRKDLAFWTLKHESFAAREAKVLMQHVSSLSATEESMKASLLGSQPARKRWIKGNVYAQCPLFVRALAYFAYRYFGRLGFLDGYEGLVFHFLQGCWYRFYVDAKIWEASHVKSSKNSSKCKQPR